MTQYDEIDEEIDRDMGWADKVRRSAAKRPPRKNPFAPLMEALKVFSPLYRALATIGRGFRRIAFFPIISPLSYSKNFNSGGDMVVVKRSIGWRILDGLLTRLLLTPVFLALFLFYVVYANTHPARVLASSTPESMNVYFKRVSLLTIDNQRLAGWYIPPLTSDEVAFDPEGALMEKWPAVVVCHGLGAAQDQYLSLSRQLHNDGFAVLMLDTRGQGDSETAVVTYGLRSASTFWPG